MSFEWIRSLPSKISGVVKFGVISVSLCQVLLVEAVFVLESISKISRETSCLYTFASVLSDSWCEVDSEFGWVESPVRLSGWSPMRDDCWSAESTCTFKFPVGVTSISSVPVHELIKRTNKFMHWACKCRNTYELVASTLASCVLLSIVVSVTTPDPL